MSANKDTDIPRFSKNQLIRARIKTSGLRQINLAEREAWHYNVDKTDTWMGSDGEMRLCPNEVFVAVQEGALLTVIRARTAPINVYYPLRGCCEVIDVNSGEIFHVKRVDFETIT